MLGTVDRLGGGDEVHGGAVGAPGELCGDDGLLVLVGELEAQESYERQVKIPVPYLLPVTSLPQA